MLNDAVANIASYWLNVPSITWPVRLQAQVSLLEQMSRCAWCGGTASFLNGNKHHI